MDGKNTTKCWLLDPPSDDIEGDPDAIKTTVRLEYVADIISLLAPFAKLPKALRERASQWMGWRDNKNFETVRRLSIYVRKLYRALSCQK